VLENGSGPRKSMRLEMKVLKSHGISVKYVIESWLPYTAAVLLVVTPMTYVYVLGKYLCLIVSIALLQFCLQKLLCTVSLPVSKYLWKANWGRDYCPEKVLEFCGAKSVYSELTLTSLYIYSDCTCILLIAVNHQRECLDVCGVCHEHVPFCCWLLEPSCESVLRANAAV